MKKKALIMVHIGDIHFGAFDSERLYKELKYEFIKKIKRLPRIDLLSINGDLFDRDLSMNTNHAYYLMRFLDDLYKLARKGFIDKIRIIKGTKSHDHDQLDSIIIPEDIDIKIFSKVSKEILFESFKVLYLPEEYIKDMDEYYKEYFNDEYNLILGHGMFEETAFNNFNSEVTMESSPVFNSKELSKICKGPIIFGHIHNGYSIKDKIFYTGSFSRWCQGEEDPKGFIINIMDMNSNFKIIPVINEMARVFITRNITKIIERKSTEECIKMIETHMENKNIFKFAAIINTKNDSEFMGKVSSLQHYFADNRNIKLTIEDDLIDDISQDDEEIIERYNYLFDDKISTEDKMSKFAYDMFGYSISPERVNQLLTEDILKLTDIDSDGDE